MKLCKDCRYFDEYKSNIQQSKCKSLQDQLPPNPIDGTIKGKWVFCDVLRKEYHDTLNVCGLEGKWFEPRVDEPSKEKHTVFKSLINWLNSLFC